MIPVEEKTKKVTEGLRLLIGLQELDTRIFKLKEKKAEIPREIEVLQSSLKKERDSLEERQSEYERLKKLKKEKEMVLDEGLEKLKKQKARTSDIKTNKEYQAHVKEIEASQTDNRNIEDEIISLMERMEESYKLLNMEETRYAEIVKRFEGDRKTYEAEGRKIEEELAKLREKRKEIASKISQELYDNYSKILKTGKGLAVVQIKEGSCTGCHMSLPPQLINDVRKNEEIIDCSNCHRILYYEGIEEL